MQNEHPVASPRDSAAPRWLLANTHPLVTDNPECPLGTAESIPLRDVVGSARMVAIGEAVHGSATIARMRDRLIRWLVAEEGFRVLALEEGSAVARKLDEFVRFGTGTAREALIDLGFWIWLSEEFANTVEWIRRFNLQQSSPQEMVHIVGFDIQGVDQYRAQALDILRKHAHQLAPTLTGVHTLLEQVPSDMDMMPKEEDWQADGSIPADDPHQHRLRRVAEAARMIRASAPGLSQTAVCHLDRLHRVVRQAWRAAKLAGLDDGRAYHEYRDRCSAGNVLGLLRECPDTRVILAGHHAHLIRAPWRMDHGTGPSSPGAQWVAICVDGSVRTTESSAHPSWAAYLTTNPVKGGPVNWEVAPLRDGSIERLVMVPDSADHPTLTVFPPDSQNRSYATNDTYRIRLGGATAPEDSSSEFGLTSVRSEFDALIVLPRSEAMTVLAMS